MTTERRLRNAALAERAVLIDKAFLDETTAFLRAIVERLASVVGPSLLTRWFREAAARDWGRDEIDYCRIKLLTTYIQSRPTELPVVDEASYTGDLHRYG